MVPTALNYSANKDNAQCNKHQQANPIAKFLFEKWLISYFFNPRINSM